MIIADLLDNMGAVDNETNVTAGGSDEASSIQALWMATKYMESVGASIAGVFSEASGVGPNPVNANLLTTANNEATAIPSNLLRVDSLWATDPSTHRPVFEMTPIHHTGGHMPSMPSWWWGLAYASNGRPWGYYQDSRYFFWSPVPDGAYQIRAYGMWGATMKYADRNANFPYPDDLALPVSMFAQRFATMALDDSTEEIKALAIETFTPALRAQRRRNRQGPRPREYSHVHVT